MPGKSRIITATRGGHALVLDDVTGQVELRHSNGSVIVIDAAGTVTVTATGNVEIAASAVNIQSPLTTFAGVVQCQTLVASDGVVSPSYTPGAGNVW